jgi:hypothetical protein
MITNKLPMAKIAIHAPAMNFVRITMISTVPVQRNPMPRRGVPFGAQQPCPVPHHPDLAQRERHEDTDDVQLDQRGHLGAERDNERHRGQRQKQDAVRER